MNRRDFLKINVVAVLFSIGVRTEQKIIYSGWYPADDYYDLKQLNNEFDDFIKGGIGRYEGVKFIES